MRAAVAVFLSLAVVAVAAPPAAAAPWSCDAFGYLFQAPTGSPPGMVQRIDLATGAFSTYGNTPGDVINATGYNTLDDYFYGWNLTTGTMVRIGSELSPAGDLTLTPVPAPPGFPGSVIGDFDGAGHYWTWAAGSIYEIDYAPGSATYGELVGAPVPSAAPAGLTTGADWAWIDGFLYRLMSDATGAAHLVRVDPATGLQTDLTPGGLGFGGGFGAVYADASGYLYGSDNADGDLFRIDPVTLEWIQLPTATGASSNDGARCAAAPVPSITVTKTVGGRVRPADQFTVGLTDAGGATLTSATTAGAATTASTPDWPVSQGQTYTITDAMAAGAPTPSGEYVRSIACVDAAGAPVATGGGDGSWTLTVADATFYTCNVTNRAVADLEMAKSAAPSPVVPGEDVTWTITVTNRGPSTSIGETVTDQLPAEATFSAASAGCGEAGGTVTCAVGELAPGASRTFTVTARVASDLGSCLRNSATVSGRFDPDPSDNSSTICSPIRASSNIAIAKDASSATVAAGGQVMYTLVVRNTGPSDDPNVTVTDPLPPGLALVSADPSQGSCTTSANTVSCDLGALRDGGSAQVLVTAGASATSGCITNSAQAQGANEDPDPSDNQASVQVCVDPPPPPSAFDLEVEKRADVRRPYVGQAVTYRIVVRNSGPAAVQDVTLTDTINAAVRVVSVRASEGRCERRNPMRCELGTIAAGDTVTIRIVAKHREATGCSPRQRQAASATGSGTDAEPADNMDTVDVCVRQIPRLVITKVASRDVVRAGERFGYRIRVRNPTRGEARDVRVCDRLPSGLRYVSSEPRATRSGRRRCWTIERLGARKSRTFRVTVRAANGATGRRTNTASARSPDVQRRTRARDRIRVLGVATPVTG